MWQSPQPASAKTLAPGDPLPFSLFGRAALLLPPQLVVTTTTPTVTRATQKRASADGAMRRMTNIEAQSAVDAKPTGTGASVWRATVKRQYEGMDSARAPEYSLVVPVYNEEDTLPELAAPARGLLDGSTARRGHPRRRREQRRSYELMPLREATRASSSCASRGTSVTRSRSPRASTSRRATP